MAVDIGQDAYAYKYNGSFWSAPTTVDAGRSLASVSCPSRSFCVAVDRPLIGYGGPYNGGALIYNGSSWSVPKRVDAKNSLSSVSCASRLFCVALDDAGRALKYNGSSWGVPKRIDGGRTVDSVSCPSSSFCMAVDAAGNALEYNGSSWSAPTWIEDYGLGSVSCPSSSFCAAVDSIGHPLIFSPGPAFLAGATTAALLKETTPRGKAAHIGALLKAGGYTISFKALTAGRAVADWYYIPAGAHLAAAKPKPVLVASGSRTFTAASVSKLTIRLTAAGRKLLGQEQSNHAKRLRLTAKASFRPPGKAAVLLEKTFKLAR